MTLPELTLEAQQIRAKLSRVLQDIEALRQQLQALDREIARLQRGKT